jgi:ribonuclease P protein component
MAEKYTLGSRERLKSKKEIDLLFKKGKRFSTGNLRVIYLSTPAHELRFGVAVANKLFPKAVNRNRIKRLIREAYRTQKHLLPEETKKTGLHLFIMYTGKTIPLFSEIMLQVKDVLKRFANS